MQWGEEKCEGQREGGDVRKGRENQGERGLTPAYWFHFGTKLPPVAPRHARHAVPSAVRTQASSPQLLPHPTLARCQAPLTLALQK